jgi:TRAP-type C4-dicarboxylate transport system permease small subunit
MMLKRLNQGLMRWAHPSAKVLNRIASGVLFLMMLLTIIDVVLRKLFNASILGTVELTEFLLVILIFFSLAQAEILNQHVKVDLVMQRFKKRTQGWVDMATQFVCFVLCGLITWSTLAYAGRMKASAEVSQDLWIPIYFFVYAVAAGCALFCICLLIKSLTALVQVIKS